MQPIISTRGGRNYTLSKFENLSYEKNGIENLIDRCFSKFLKKYDYTELKNKKKYDLLVDIGGSLFIENGKLMKQEEKDQFKLV